jgi:hypothetical protein
MTEKTEIIWTYTPSTYLEQPYRTTIVGADIELNSGSATATLQVPKDPFSDELLDLYLAIIHAVLTARQSSVNRPFEITGPQIHQHQANGVESIGIRVGEVMVMTDVLSPDILMTDADGKVVKDTRAEREAAETQHANEFANAAAKSAIVRKLFRSYQVAIDDPGNELVHLYEIPDFLAEHFGNGKTARSSLGISRAYWSRLKELANDEPLLEGRHRGKHTILRHATASEKDEARKIAQLMLDSFVKTV